jgi:CRP-like cAMP-binding protein
MECPNCRAEVTEKAKFCNECGKKLGLLQPETSSKQTHSGSGIFRSLSGLRRTLSTEIISDDEEETTLEWFDSLIEIKKYGPGDVILRKGEKNRDLYFLAEGHVEITSEEKDGNILLNEIKDPNIFGDLGFLFGFRRTATAIAKTEVKLFMLNYEIFSREITEFPDWLSPMLSSLVSGIKELHDEIIRLEKKVSE